MGELRKFTPRGPKRPTGGFPSADPDDDPSNDLATARYAREDTEAEVFRIGKLIERVNGRVSPAAVEMLRMRLREYTDDLAAIDEEIPLWEEIVAEVGDEDPTSGA